jgi:hypothetical protein
MSPSAEHAISDVIDLDRLCRRDRLGGLIHEYQLAAQPRVRRRRRPSV